ncbi:MAG: aminotransferase class IV [Bacteroidales bacterium]|nr:aminotransferase class IV [Bacteroidales bacterium]
MSECINKLFLLNGNFIESGHFNDNQVNKGISFYEVIRIMQNRYLFFEDHTERLRNSIEIFGIKYKINIEYIKDYLLKYLIKTKLTEGNVKVVLSFSDTSDNNPQVFVYQIKHYYPNVNDYTAGVSLLLANAERVVPNAKTINMSIKKIAADKLNKAKYFETLLVNKKNKITEGSRSNVFFTSADTLFTAPDSEVLCGVTRKHVLELCTEKKIPVNFELVDVDSLPCFDAVFITGTSIKLLPVKEIDNLKYNVQNNFIRKLMHYFDERIQNYIKV